MPEMPDPWSTGTNWSEGLARFNPPATNKHDHSISMRFEATRDAAKSMQHMRETFNLWSTNSEAVRFLFHLGLHHMAEASNDEEFKLLVQQSEIANQALDLERRIAENKALCDKLEDLYKHASSPEEVRAAISLVYNATDHSDTNIRMTAKKIVKQHEARTGFVIPDQIPAEWDD